MAITRGDIETELAGLRADVAAGGYAAARVHLLNARSMLVGLPDSKSGDQEIGWRTSVSSECDAIERTLNRLEAMAATATAAHGVRTSKITYARTSA